MPQPKNKIAVVTGGSSGIGLAPAKRFAEESGFVFIAGPRLGRDRQGRRRDRLECHRRKDRYSKLDDLDRLYADSIRPQNVLCCSEAA